MGSEEGFVSLQCMFGSKLKARLSRRKLIKLSSAYPLLVSKDGAWHEGMALGKIHLVGEWRG